VKAKRQNAAILALLVFFFSVFPAKRSEAVVPLAIGLGMQIYGAAAAVTFSEALTATGVALVGGTAMALLFSISGDSSKNVRVPLTAVQAQTDSAMPFPSAPSTAEFGGGTAPVEGTTDPAASGYVPVGGSKTYKTPFDACVGQLLSMGMPPIGQTGGRYFCTDCETSGTGGLCSVYDTATGNYPTDVESISKNNPGCPPGYTASTSGTNTCALTNPRLVTNDFLADFQRNGQQYTFADMNAAPSYVSSASDRVSVSGVDSQGRNTRVDIFPTSDGGSIVDMYRQGSAGNITRDRATVSPSGVVTGVQTQTVPGSISAPNDATSPAVVTGITTGVGAGTGTGTGTGTGSDSIVFPSDYARTGEAAQAADVVKTSVDGVKDKLTDSVSVADPVVPEWVDPWGVTFNALRGWSLPSHSSSCPVGSFSWENRTYAFDTHCQLVADHWGVLQVAMTVVWVVLALFIVLGA